MHDTHAEATTEMCLRLYTVTITGHKVGQLRLIINIDLLALQNSSSYYSTYTGCEGCIRSIINAQSVLWDEYKRGTAAKHDLPYFYMEHVIFRLRP